MRNLKTIIVPVPWEIDGSRKVHAFEVVLEDPSPNARLIAYQHRSLITFAEDLNFGGTIYPDYHKTVPENLGEFELRVQRLFGSWAMWKSTTQHLVP